ncbi:hypothetical protein [Streptomyces sp. HNM0574]|uniref:hypothetical protein n=1 Tax=Streptomyces sp. HNM0574 TaxID=2714954 RepID=UPI0019D2F089|nr:hypothetical protein [Streptomyces sp. HNM0574]
MGWTVLYIAFGVVALWLLAEVLLQYKARLRWRLLAFAGFAGVVAGAVIPSVVVIGIGIAAFATGQTYVTLSHRRGFVNGWALTGKPGAGRRGRRERAPEAEPTLQVSGLEAEAPGAAPAEAPAAGGFDTGTFEIPAYGSPGFGPSDLPGQRPDEDVLAEPSVFQPGPLPDETDQYPAYGHYDRQPQADLFGGGYAPEDQTAYPAQGYDGYGHPAQDGFQGQQSYAAYSDPYIAYDGSGSYAGPDGYAAPGGYDTGWTNAPGYPAPDGYDTSGYDPLTYDPPGYDPLTGNPAPQQYAADGYGSPYGEQPGPYGYDGSYDGQFATQGGAGDGLWFPQQRDPNAPFPPEQQYYGAETYGAAQGYDPAAPGVRPEEQRGY